MYGEHIPKHLSIHLVNDASCGHIDHRWCGYQMYWDWGNRSWVFPLLQSRFPYIVPNARDCLECLGYSNRLQLYARMMQSKPRVGVNPQTLLVSEVNSYHIWVTTTLDASRLVDQAWFHWLWPHADEIWVNFSNLGCQYCSLCLPTSYNRETIAIHPIAPTTSVVQKMLWHNPPVQVDLLKLLGRFAPQCVDHRRGCVWRQHPRNQLPPSAGPTIHCFPQLPMVTAVRWSAEERCHHPLQPTERDCAIQWDWDLPGRIYQQYVRIFSLFIPWPPITS